MDQKTKTWRVGLLVITGFALFALAIFVLGKQQSLFGSTFTLQAAFTNISGLQVGNNVRYNGINVGTVTDIVMLTDTSVVVKMLVEKSTQKFIRKNSKAVIGSEGLMGDKVVTITTGTDNFEIVKDNDIILTEPPIETDQIMSSLLTTAENAEIISSELALIMFKVNNGQGPIGRLLSDTSLADDLSETLENLKNSSEGLNENMEAAKGSILLRGYFKKQKKEEEKKEQERKALEQQKKEEEKK